MLASGCAASPVASLSPTLELTPVPGAATATARASVGPLDEAWNGESIQDALKALDDLTSYQFTSQSQLGHMSGTVVNDDPPRWSVDMASVMGGPPMSAVVIGADQYMRYAGGQWSRPPGGGMPASSESPVRSMLPMGFQDMSGDPMDSMWTYPAFVDVGVEAHNGVEARHIRAVGDGKPANPDDGSFSGGDVFKGTIDAWIAVDGGYLVALRVNGRWVTPDLEPTPEPSFKLPFDFEDATADVSIRAVDDPANVVEAPEIPPATPKPSGDPAVIALLDGLAAANEGLTTFRADTVSTGGSLDMDSTLVVAGGPPRRMRMTVNAPSMGMATEIVVIGKDIWQRQGDGPWDKVPASDAQGCMSNAGTSIQDCLGTSMLGSTTVLSTPETYERLPGTETIDGIETIHLRSTAGYTAMEQNLPGTSDLWIAAEGGWLVRNQFSSDFMGVVTDIRRLRDSDVKVERPVP